ncbi:MAG: hypothetical protein HY005_02270 [Candidatus Staskawiczbacteria bacterium]|nr:hypothetical protein [Candidatus Staskawiczbacteria bacterium]MBI3337428.1 hypothetical protein [Candidatus Staskawiczbacteria bacterium]
MKIRYKKVFLVCLGVIIFLLLLNIDINRDIKINTVSALEVTYPTVLGFSITENSSFIEYARYFFNIGMAIAGTLAVMAIIFGGVYYLISFNRGKFTNEGKQWIKAGILGLLLLVSSYLIAYTINPDLVYFRLEKLFPVGFLGLPGNSIPPGSPITNYEEIPLGTLTENLLSRTMDCYDYDNNGDPIEQKITTDDNKVINGPTLLNHDRADCFLKLTEAAEKKSKLIKKLSDEIIKLMESCTCAGKCDNTCDANSPGACGTPVGEQCLTGSCVGAACKPFEGKSNDCCPADSGIKNPKTNKNFTVKEIIEHGPIKIGDKEFKGLDEFRTQLVNISNFVEIRPGPKKDEKEITVINNGDCQICNNSCFQCDPKDQNCLTQCKNTNNACQNNRKICLENSKWDNLKLIEQLMYFQEKMGQIKTSVEQDHNQLNSARTKIANCYNVKSSVDLLGILEETKKDEKIILSTKPFRDSITNQVIDSSKYCEGFNYANSNSYSKCQNICPETMENKTCYNSCQKCDEKDPQKQAACLKNQTQCVKNCYDNRKCPSTANPPFATFKDCMQKLDQSCLGMCNVKYSGSQTDIEKCQEKCEKDSKCLLDNEEICTVDFPQLKSCSDEYKDLDNLKNCVNNSSLCEYGSDEYSGYPDCIKTQGQYSSSFLYKNPNNQKCKNPYETYTTGVNIRQTCLDLYPETAKCPTSSKCPKCPCGIIDETIDYNSGESGGGGGGGGGEKCPPGSCRGADGICSPGNCGGGSIVPFKSNSGNSTTTILEYQVITGTCNEFTYIGDPLTFYCRTAWEPEGYISGKWLYDSKTDEIPVGQTVDDTKKWANKFTENISDFTKTTAEMIQYIKNIGQEQKYCQCDSTCENGRPCSTSCQYVPPAEDPNDPSRNIPAYCAVAPCDGISCQKIINLLRGGSTQNCPVNKDGVFYYYDKIYKGSKTFYEFITVDERTDVLKELSYSRKKMNECSQQAVKLGKDTVQTFNCTNAYRGVSALQKRCYGIYDGQVKTPSEDKTDNWFCLKTLLK